MYEDRVKIFIKSGDGGRGITSFATSKYVRVAPPDGGDGGKGGDVVFVASQGMNSLLDFRFKKYYRAENGEDGGKNNKTGKSGSELRIVVPCGTVIRDAETGNIMADMFRDKQEFAILVGGEGGKGNARFKSSKRRSPTFSQTGQKTAERSVWLELKTIADVGLVGFPNVGKSTLLSVLTAAKPKIANYHFTTLSPNLGVAKIYDESIVFADIPGLIEGASQGVGLGHYFLRHIERTRLLLHVIDISGEEGRDPYTDFLTVNKELKKYSAIVAKLPQIIVLNKSEMPTAEVNKKKFLSKLSRRKVQPIVLSVSAVTNSGIEELLKVVHREIVKLPPVQPLEFEGYEYELPDKNSWEIVRDDDGAFVIVGGFVDELIRNIVLSDAHSFAYFQKTLKEKGIIKQLKKMGADENSIIRIADFDFELID